MDGEIRFWDIDLQKERGRWALARFTHLYRRALSLSSQGRQTGDPEAKALVYALYSCYLDCQTEGMAVEAKRAIEAAEREADVRAVAER